LTWEYDGYRHRALPIVRDLVIVGMTSSVKRGLQIVQLVHRNVQPGCQSGAHTVERG
jgi:hypothetical protein